jgi:hypothetical protein
MVPGRDLVLARDLLAEYRSGTLQSDEGRTNLPICPGCHAPSGNFDLRQRRWVILAFLVIGLVLALLLTVLDAPLIPYFVLSYAFWLVLMMPHLLRHVVNNRLQCGQCHHAWRELPQAPFSEQQRQTENASAEPFA